MAHYAVGNFESGRSGSPYQFVSKNLQPEGPFAVLDINRRRTIRPDQRVLYLFELEEWHSIDQRKQYVTKIIASLSDIAHDLHEALKSAEWEREPFEPGKRCIVGRVLKTEYGYFSPRYDNGQRANGQDENPVIWMSSYRTDPTNPYGDALGTALAQGYLCCMDEAEIKRAHDAGIAK